MRVYVLNWIAWMETHIIGQLSKMKDKERRDKGMTWRELPVDTRSHKYNTGSHFPVL